MSVETKQEQGVGWITIDAPPVNALSQEVAQGIVAAVDQLEQDPEVRAIVVTAKGRTFIAGANVRDFQQMIEEGNVQEGAGLYEVTNRLEQSKKPVVCAIFGTTLGGGLELAMACHYRIALQGSLIGQPEVKLGLIPGAGGTQRLPRLCGVLKAAELCGLGEPISVEVGLELGIVDRVVTEDLNQATLDFALHVINEGPRPTCDRTEKLEGFGTAEKKQLDVLKKTALEKYAGASASSLAVDAVEKSVELSFEDGLAIENELFVQVLGSDEARNLINLFFAERAASKIPVIKNQQEWQAANQIGFPSLFSDDVGMLESLIRAGVQLQIVDQESFSKSEVDFLFLREIPEPDDPDGPQVKSSGLVVATADNFYPERIVELGFDPANIVGLRFWPGGDCFAEIGITDVTSPFAIKSIVELVKRLGCLFVVEKPSPFYASARVREHRFDESDLKIEVWKLLQEKIVERASDVDLIQVYCFGQPRHKAAIGASAK